MENLWESCNNYVWIEGFLDILWSSIKYTVDWQLSCPKTGANFTSRKRFAMGGQLRRRNRVCETLGRIYSHVQLKGWG